MPFARRGDILRPGDMLHEETLAMGTGIVAAAVFVLAVGGAAVALRPGFGRLPRGERLERIRRSPNYRDGAFRNRQPTALMTSGGGRFRTLWNYLTADRKGRYPEEPVPAVRTDLRGMPSSDNRMVWFGHSSYLLQLDGKSILVDPVFHWAAPVPFVNRAFPGTELYAPADMPDIDCLVITHDHWDHLDYRTVKELRTRVKKVVCPLGVGAHFEYWGFDRNMLVELDWQECAALDTAPAIRVHCLPARHFSGRGLISNKTLWASFLLETPSMKVYIGGDGGYGTHFAAIGREHPGIDLAILENGQYSDDWRYIHLLPRWLGQAAADLKAKRLVTVHHSKYALARHRWDEPLENELRAAEEYSLDLTVACIGEAVPLAGGRVAAGSDGRGEKP